MTRTALRRPARSAEQEHGEEGCEEGQLDAERRAAAGGEPGGQHRGERHDALDREVHVAGDDAEGEAHRQQAHEGGVLEDVDEDAELEEVLDRDRAQDKDDGQDAPDQMVEGKPEERGRASTAGPSVERQGQGWSVLLHDLHRIGGRAEIAPEALVVDIVLGDGGPGIFRFGPHSSIVSSLFSPFTS